MIKIIISFTKLVFAAVITLLFASCDHVKPVKGSGNVKSEIRNISEDFTGVQSNKGIEVTVEQSDKKEVVVEADDNIIKHITTRVENGTLVISSDYNAYNNVKSKKVTVKMPVVKNLEASGGSNLNSKNTLKSAELNVKSDGGSGIDITVESDNVNAESSGGSHTKIAGIALTLNSSSSSGSAMDTEKLMANEVNAQASGGSSTNVHAILSLDAKASSGASVDFYGNPKRVSKEQSSGGSVNQK